MPDGSSTCCNEILCCAGFQVHFSPCSYFFVIKYIIWYDPFGTVHDFYLLGCLANAINARAGNTLTAQIVL